ncbi:MAG: hypothetical protein J5892_04110 [Bacilli bacterium]|nr:hypothetical protein [Bacilli bacterium]
MKKTNRKKVKMLKGEQFLYLILLIILVAIPILKVYSQAKLSETNIEVEQLSVKIERQESINESVSMKINELVSLDKIQNVANEIGLSYNNDNIKVIKEN